MRAVLRILLRRIPMNSDDRRRLYLFLVDKSKVLLDTIRSTIHNADS